MSRGFAVLPWPSRLLSLLGLGLWLVAAVAGIWEALASQSPDSPFHLGILAGPVAQLESHSFMLGTVLMGLSWAWPRWVAPEQGTFALYTLVGGALLETFSLAWAASSGMLAVQILDPRPDARLMLYARALGHSAFLLGGLCLVPHAVRALRADTPGPSA